MKIVVVGAGVVGASIAHRLAEAGAQVTLIEAGRVGGGTSSTSYAWVNACEKLDSQAYYDLNYAGVMAHRRLIEEFGGANWLHRPGVIQWADAGAEAEGFDKGNFDKLARLQELGYPARSIQAEELAALEPDIDLATFTEAGAILYPEDGWLDAMVYSGAVVRRAIDRHGLTLLTGTRVTGIVARSGAAQGVMLDDGREVPADVVVNCGGRWANEVAGAEEFGLPLAPTIGLIAYTVSCDTSLRHALRTPLLNCRPDGAGRILLRANDVDRTVSAGSSAVPEHPAAQELLARLVILMPVLQGVHVEAVRIATRPIPADGLSAIGHHPRLQNYYVAVTHSGVTMGAFLGEAVTEELVNGRRVSELAEFGLERFFG